MHAIHNGFDWNAFAYTQPKAIFELIPPEIANHPIVLFPHRPEVPKGIYEVIEVAEKLVRDYGWKDLRVLVPRWLDAESEPSNRSYFEELHQRINTAGLSEVFVFHEWINEAMIAEYYSLADVTLCIGGYVETFGNTPFESLGCGTLPIVSRVATYRDLLPDEHIDRVDYGDVEAAAATAHAILSERRRASDATLAYLKSRFSLQAMVTQYADVILNAVKKPPIEYRVPTLSGETVYKLAPWCFISQSRGIYHDFRNNYQVDGELIRLVDEHPDGFTGASIDSARLHDWLDDGYIVPVVRA